MFHTLQLLSMHYDIGGVRDTCLAEALAAAYTDLQWEKDSLKYCLICSSTPSDHPCTLPGPFIGKPASFIVREMVKKSGVLFSIITPFRSAKWKSIFESSKILSGKGPIGVSVKKEGPNSMETENLSHEKLNIANGCFEGTNLSQEVSSKEHLVRLILENAAKVTNTKTLNLLGFKDTFIELRGIVLNPQSYAASTATATTGASATTMTTTGASTATNGNNLQPLLPFTITTKHSPSPTTTGSSPGMVSQQTGTKLSPSSKDATTSIIGTTTESKDSTGSISSPISTISSPNTSTATTPENTSTSSTTHQQGVFIHKLTLNVEGSHLLGSFELYAKTNDFENVSKWPKEYEMKKSVYLIKQNGLVLIIKKQIPLCYWKVVSESPKFLQHMKAIISKKFCLVINIDEKKSMIVYPYQIYKAIRKQQPLSTEASKSEPIFVSCVLDTPIVEKLVDRIQVSSSSSTSTTNPTASATASTNVPTSTTSAATTTAGTATIANPATLAPTIVKPPSTASGTTAGMPPGMPIGLYPFPYAMGMIPTGNMAMMNLPYGQFMLGMPNLTGGVTPMPTSTTGNIVNTTTNTNNNNNNSGNKK